MRVIGIANQKGGCAKTTTSINLAAGLARSASDGKRVLLIDLDPQSASTAVLLGAPFALGPQQGPVIHEVLVSGTSAAQAIRQVRLNGSAGVPPGVLDVLPSHLNLAAAEMELIKAFERERVLAKALAPLRDLYDFTIIDCPPSLGLLTVNALMAAREVLIPVDPGYFPLIGLGLLRKTIDMVRQANPALHVMGVLPVRQTHTILTRDTEQALHREFGDLVLPAIPERVALNEAHAAGKDIFAYDPQSDAALAYGKLVLEVISRG